MDQLISESLRDFNVLSPISPWELMLSLSVTAILTYILVQVYMFTHGGHSYSRSYVHTIIFIGITISLIMIIIGSNIARAFALVGAMSIIRFRNPVKDSRDVAFLFMAMAIGMAAGTKFYLFAAIFTGFISFVAVVMHTFRIGELAPTTFVIRMRMNPALRESVEKLFDEIGANFYVISIDSLANQAGLNDFMYELVLRKGSSLNDLIGKVGKISEEISVNLMVGEGNVNV